MRRFFLCLLMMLIATGSSNTCLAFLEFHKEWVNMYVDKEDESKENQDYIKLVTRGATRCLVCHQGRKRTNHNPYGQHFVGVIGKDDKKDTEKIVAILEKVGKMPADPEADANDENVVTYNDLIEQKKFPGGELEDLKQEPEEDAEKATE